MSHPSHPEAYRLVHSPNPPPSPWNSTSPIAVANFKFLPSHPEPNPREHSPSPPAPPWNSSPHKPISLAKFKFLPLRPLASRFSKSASRHAWSCRYGYPRASTRRWCLGQALLSPLSRDVWRSTNVPALLPGSHDLALGWVVVVSARRSSCFVFFSRTKNITYFKILFI